MKLGKYQNLYRRWLKATASKSEYEFCVGIQDSGNPFLFSEEACRDFLRNPAKFPREREKALSWDSPEELEMKLVTMGY